MTKVELQTSLAPSSASGSNMAVQTAPSCPQSPPYAIGAIKVCPDGETVTLAGKVVTHVLGSGIFYLEEDDRSAGIKVQKASHGVTVGDRVTVSGSLATDANSERYIAATSATVSGDGLILPMYLVNRDLGGGDLYYSAGPPASGQMGVTGGFGLNNIGLLVRTSGTIVQADSASPPQWFRIDDGSGVSVKVDLSLPQGGPVPMQAGEDDFVTVTGISSCEVSGTDVVRVIRPSVGGPLAFDPPGGDFCDCLPVRIIAPVGVRVLYTVDGSEPGETNPAARVYDPSGCVLVMPPATIKARAFDGGCSSVGSYSATYGQRQDCGGGGATYTCWQWSAPSQAAQIAALRVTGIGLSPRSMTLGWSDSAGLCQLKRKLAADSTPWDQVSLLPGAEQLQSSTYEDVFGFTFGAAYKYAVRTLAWQDAAPQNLPEHGPQCPGYPDSCTIFHLNSFTASEWREITATPARVLASQNCSVDRRLDTRYVEEKLVDFQFGGSVYRGGLFVGYAPPQDASGTARSYLQFELPYLTGNRLWTGSFDVYHTRALHSEQATEVGCHVLSDNAWDEQSITWSNAPALNTANPAERVVTDGATGVQGEQWCKFGRVFGDIASRTVPGNSNVLSLALCSTSEVTPGWAYFARKQYSEDLAPQILYAYAGDADVPVFPATVRLASSSVREGDTVHGMVFLNAPAPTGGVSFPLHTSSACDAQAGPSISFGAGAMSAPFTVSTAITGRTQSSSIQVVAGVGPLGASADLEIRPQ